MSRRAFPVCAGVLALLGAVLGMAIEPWIDGYLPSAPECASAVPRELPLAWRGGDPRPLAASRLSPVALAEQTAAEVADEPSAAAETPAPAPAAPSQVKVLKPAAKLKSATPFVYEGIQPLEPVTAPTPAPAAKSVPGALVIKKKTQFVAPEITAAEPPVGAAPQAPPAAPLAPAPVVKPPVAAAPAPVDKTPVAVAPAPVREPEPAVAPAVEPAPQPQPTLAEQAPSEPEQMPLAESDAISEPLERSVPLVQLPPRTPEVVAAVNRANEKVRHGFELAERGALYSARAEFAEALKLIAHAYDAQQADRPYGKSLAAGLAALKESADFVQQSQNLTDVSIANIIVPHVTPALKDADHSALTLMDAAQCYYTYAQEQLSAATSGEVCGSMALYGMGRVAVVVGKSNGQQLAQTGQAAALFRAALIAQPRNFRAANELGVLLAENGQLELARDLLVRSVSVSPQVTTWRNLAVVHKRIGQANLSQQAEAQALAMQKSGHGPKTEPAVEWVDPATFATTKPASDNQLPPVAPKTEPTTTKSAGAAKPEQPPTNVAKKGIAEWLGLGPRR